MFPPFQLANPPGISSQPHPEGKDYTRYSTKRPTAVNCFICRPFNLLLCEHSEARGKRAATHTQPPATEVWARESNNTMVGIVLLTFALHALEYPTHYHGPAALYCGRTVCSTGRALS